MSRKRKENPIRTGSLDFDFEKFLVQKQRHRKAWVDPTGLFCVHEDNIMFYEMPNDIAVDQITDADAEHILSADSDFLPNAISIGEMKKGEMIRYNRG